MSTVFNLNNIVNAKRRISPYINDTPILTSSLLNKWLGHEIYFKAEGLQKTGAFKARGACNVIASLVEDNKKPNHIVANSSGNHAQAVAWASHIHGIKSSIYIPSFSSKVKIQATKAYGSEVILCESRPEADERVKQHAKKKNTYWIPPFNHEMVIHGQGTAAYESLNEINDIDAIFAPCGGGGLLSGTLIAARGLVPKAKVIGAEPLNANDAASSIRSGKIHQLTTTPNTLADGAMTMAVGDITFEYLKHLDDILEITESDISYWTQWLTHLLKLQIEPTSSLSMAAAKQWMGKQAGKKKILIILSGGNIDHTSHSKIWESDFLTTPPS